MSYLRSHARLLAIDPARFGKTDVHIHVPAGAVPKDGPSAGVAIAAALMSLFRARPIHQNLAMTGEVTLTGRVLPVGGVREKILAARRAGIHVVLIPHHNEKDLSELPTEVKADVSFHLIDTLDDVVPHLFPAKARTQTKASPPRAKLTTSPPRVLPSLDQAPPAAEKPVRRPGSV
jgi:ATP-dependent Lon protease